MKTPEVFSLVAAGFAAVCALALYLKEQPPEPCVANLSSTSYPFWDYEQQWLDNPIAFPEDSELYKDGIQDSRDWVYRLVELSENSDHPSSVYVNPQNNREYWVPGLCWVGKVNSFGEPILYRR